MRKLLLSVSMVTIGLMGCMSNSYLKPDNLRFQDKNNLKTQVLNVVRDQKLCNDDTVDKQNCPINFYVDDIKAASFYINNTARFYLKPETYNLKVKNCTNECSVCETEINPAEIKDAKIVLSVDDQGLPFMLNSDNQMICERQPKQSTNPEVAPAAPVETKTEVNLSADTLFRFDGSSLSDLLPKGHQEVLDVANKIKSGYTSVRQINLVGHTDRLGKENYNQQLGAKRAATVRDVLVQNGVSQNIITTASAGEDKPVTDGCYVVQQREALKACLQPDRRVTVEIIGIAK